MMMMMMMMITSQKDMNLRANEVDESVYASIVLQKADDFQKQQAKVTSTEALGEFFAGEGNSTCTQEAKYVIEMPETNAIDATSVVGTLPPQPGNDDNVKLTHICDKGKENRVASRVHGPSGRMMQNAPISNQSDVLIDSVNKNVQTESNDIKGEMEMEIICSSKGNQLQHGESCDYESEGNDAGDIDDTDVFENSFEVDDFTIGRLLVAIEAAALRLCNKALKSWMHFKDSNRDHRALFQAFKSVCLNKKVLRSVLCTWHQEAAALLATKRALGIIEIENAVQKSKRRGSIFTPRGIFKHTTKKSDTDSSSVAKQVMEDGDDILEEETSQEDDVLHDVNDKKSESQEGVSYMVVKTSSDQILADSSAKATTDSNRQQVYSDNSNSNSTATTSIVARDDNAFLNKQRARDEEARRRRESREAREAIRKQRQVEQERKRMEDELRVIKEERLLKLAAQKEQQERRREQERRIQARRDLIRYQTELALMHYNRARLLYDGLLPWLNLHKQFLSLLVFAKKFHERHLLTASFRSWQSKARSSTQKPIHFIKRRFLFLWLSIALDMRRARLHRALLALHENVLAERAIERTAERMYCTRLLSPCFKKWFDFKMTMILERETANLMHVCFTAFSQWKVYATEEKQRRTVEEKRARVMRKAEDLIRKFRKENQNVHQSKSEVREKQESSSFNFIDMQFLKKI